MGEAMDELKASDLAYCAHIDRLFDTILLPPDAFDPLMTGAHHPQRCPEARLDDTGIIGA